MSIKFHQVGRSFTQTDMSSHHLHDLLPVGTYTISVNQSGFFFEEIDNMTTPGKLYGKVNHQAERILNTFWKRSSSIGCLFSGEKGSGKTMLARRISQLALEQGCITLVVTSPLHGDGFNKLIQNIRQPAVVIFDEFEKVYDADEQKSLLTLLDGVFPSKKLFLLTCNDKWRIDDNMSNRPGRLLYHIEYTELGDNFIREYLSDNLNDKEAVETTFYSLSTFPSLNFDCLQAVVDEMNMYNEPLSEVLEFLNVSPSGSGAGTDYDFTLYHKGEAMELTPYHLIDSLDALPEGCAGYEASSPFNPFAPREEWAPKDLFVKLYIPRRSRVLLNTNKDMIRDVKNGHIFLATSNSDYELVLTKRAPKYLSYSY